MEKSLIHWASGDLDSSISKGMWQRWILHNLGMVIQNGKCLAMPCWFWDYKSLTNRGGMFPTFPTYEFQVCLVSTEAEGSKCYSHPFASKLQIKRKSGVSRRLQAAMPSCKWKNLSLRFLSTNEHELVFVNLCLIPFDSDHPNPWWDIEKPCPGPQDVTNHSSASMRTTQALINYEVSECDFVFFSDIVTVYICFSFGLFFGNNISFLLPCTNNNMILEKYLLMNLM